ncbi:hypothetical protein HSB1_36560 [Halogranum salarium B-1]|uniref:Uncharacterized protein n=1 Tax=Halogranum salarium B-1 TaxID=1210908 RepID=J3JEC4_9EURY|nr:hypothetical protein HSB1_36560 [Halogranum salarium B-1]
MRRHEVSRAMQTGNELNQGDAEVGQRGSVVDGQRTRERWLSGLSLRCRDSSNSRATEAFGITGNPR